MLSQEGERNSQRERILKVVATFEKDLKLFKLTEHWRFRHPRGDVIAYSLNLLNVAAWTLMAL